MTIPPEHDDDDFYICVTVEDARQTVQRLEMDNKCKDTLIETLRSNWLEADAARRHAQAVSSSLVEEKRELQRLLVEATARIKWMTNYYNLSILAYDNACLRAKEAEERAQKAESALADHVVNDIKMVESETIASVTIWANETFGKATIRTQIDRAKKEFIELVQLQEVDHDHAQLVEEAADVVICLYRVIGTLDPEAINKKMAKNRARTWKVDGNGCAQHVEEG